jgi:fatty-acyl-CoA synthase
MAVAVVAVPDPKWGEVPCAFIETRAGVTLTKEDVIAHCKQLLASFKVPKVIVFKELPKTSTGKIQKFMLREEAGSINAIDQN